MTISNKAYITATAVSCCGGNDETELLKNILEQKSGIETDTEYFNNTPAAIGKITTEKNFFDLLIQKCRETLEKSALENFEDTLLIIGSSVGGINITESIFLKEGNYKNIDPDFHNIHAIELILNKEFKFKDGISFSTACTSSANALGYAKEVIEKGIYDNVLVIGVDALSKTTVGGFLSLGVLSSKPCRPFDINRNGMNVSEAVACLLIQNKPTSNSVQIKGVGYSSDAHHMTHPHPEGTGAQKAMQNALDQANIRESQIDYINAHGTGTQANDSAEAKAIENLFSSKPYVSSTKSVTGHTLGAAGALEAVICKLLLNEQIIPANTFLAEAENKNINLLTKNIEQPLNHVMSNSFAFGGNNCSLIFGKLQ